MNRALKNNFWNGSHVWEWTAKDKRDFLPFFEDPPKLQQLSEAIGEHLPLQLAAVSDKLGSLILQIPVACIVSDFKGTGDFQGIVCEVTWHPEIPARKLLITGERRHDGLLRHSAASLNAEEASITLPMEDGPGGVHITIRDAENGVTLRAEEVNIIRSAGFNMHIRESQAREFTLAKEGTEQSEIVSIPVDISEGGCSGDPCGLAHFDDTRKRIYEEEMRVLQEQRRFLQYHPGLTDTNGKCLSGDERHQVALEDIRWLIKRYGQAGVWLWDPFLSADDVLKTLFYNPHSGSAMRALTGAQQVKEEKREMEDGTESLTEKQRFLERQRSHFKQHSGNCLGLLLEFRARIGGAGFPFHDRFLIFPHADPRPLAWSLGISVNGLGKDHHIIQQVPNGRLIADSFQQLWDALGQEECLVWETP